MIIYRLDDDQVCDELDEMQRRAGAGRWRRFDMPARVSSSMVSADVVGAALDDLQRREIIKQLAAKGATSDNHSSLSSSAPSIFDRKLQLTEVNLGGKDVLVQVHHSRERPQSFPCNAYTTFGDLAMRAQQFWGDDGRVDLVEKREGGVVAIWPAEV
tara:strand:+ start:768 stop:1238 length:471 start_codon:yes stop_codon:yes gene_type:complete